jgi:hypothetical protein
MRGIASIMVPGFVKTGTVAMEKPNDLKHLICTLSKSEQCRQGEIRLLLSIGS